MLKLLKKYGYDLPVTKSNLYKKLLAHKDIIKAEGFEFHIKSISDLMKYEIILNGIENKNRIDNLYYQFYHETQEVLKYLNYEEKQKIFNGELETVLEEMKHFHEIYIPYLEEFINKRYCHNYMMLILKQHQLYIRQYPRTVDQPFVLYGYKPMISSFSSCQALGQDDEYYYFYLDEFKRIVIFSKNEYELYDEIYLCDKYNKDAVKIDEVYRLVELFCQDKTAFFEELFSLGYIREKTYKKIKKKLK